MPYMMQDHGDGKWCVHKQNTDKTPGESMHCYTGPNAEAECKKYMAALYANMPAKEKMMQIFDDLMSELGGPGPGHAGHKGRPGEIGGSTNDGDGGIKNLPGKAKASSAAADKATKKAMESGDPKDHADARDAHMQAATDNMNAYRDVQKEDPDLAKSYKNAVEEHESTADIHDKRAGKYKINLSIETEFYSFTELAALTAQYKTDKPVGLTYIDGMAAGDFTSMAGQRVSFPAEDLQAYVTRTQAIIESTRTEKGEIVGLPIDTDKHNHEGGAGWIVGLELDKARNVIRFMVNWTNVGIDLIRSNMRRFFSPSIDPQNKIILGGSLTNWPATRHDNTGRLLLRPVELSQSIKEIDMPKTIEEMFEDLKAGLLAAVGRKPTELQQDPAPRFDGSTSPTIQELLQSPDVVEDLGRKAQELAADAIRTEKRKLHLVEFASKIAGGTKERPFGLAVRPNEIIAVLLSLPEKQALAVEKLLEKTLDSAVDFAQYGFDADGYIQKPTLPAAIKPYAAAWVASGKPISEFFASNPELGDPDNFNLAEFATKES